MKFSERKGFKPVAAAIQKDGITDELKNTLWSFFDFAYWSKEDVLSNRYGGEGQIKEYAKRLWYDVAKLPVDMFPYGGYQKLQTIRQYYFEAKWYEVYDFVEFTLGYLKQSGWGNFYQGVNKILEREMAGYRFVDEQLTDITSQEEIKVIEDVLSIDEYPGVSSHIKRALELLADRKNPDYRNSIKESISAVESIAKALTGNPKATLGDALKILEKDGKLHSALKEGFSKIYGYTSDEDGIRHSMLEEPNLDAADAKFFLIACSSFINYLKSKK